jgi:hypothetical protein
MGSFRHTPDDIIYVNSLAMPLAFFVTQEAAYALPSGYISREYVQSSHNTLSDGSTSIADTMPYTAGDTYIANVATYTANYAAYLIPTLSLSQAKTKKIGEMLFYSQSVKKIGGVVVTHTYPSDMETLDELTNEHLTYTRAGALPVSYTVRDTSNVAQTVASLNDLAAIIDKIVALHYACYVNENAHITAINALGTVGAVTAYDYTTGWPTIPYP